MVIKSREFSKKKKIYILDNYFMLNYEYNACIITLSFIDILLDYHKKTTRFYARSIIF